MLKVPITACLNYQCSCSAAVQLFLLCSPIKNCHVSSGQDFKRPVKWSWQGGRSMAHPMTGKNFIKIFPYRYCKMSWHPILLEPDIAFNLKALELLYEPFFKYGYIIEIIDRFIKEICPKQVLAIHCSPYYDMWKMVFHFFAIMWVLLGPKHNIA